MNIEAVIGANYGDEGKGLFTAYLCNNRPNPIVVLSNGGCQRGHTVNDPRSRLKHVFHHFGSGTLLGVPSIFAKTFLLNPIRYVEEKQDLECKGIHPRAFRAPGCILQLPGDMFTNQMVEKARSASGKKHGSCGWGIWETQVRNAQQAKLTFEDFAAMDYEAKRRCMLDALEWQLENRLAGVYKPLVDQDILEALASDNFIKHFIHDFEEMERSTILLGSSNLLKNDFSKHGIVASTMIVENAQGLLLDKDYAPADSNGRTDIHTTPSKCGVAGAVEAIGDEAVRPVMTANYISRTYFTRHGEGPFPEESSGLKLEDKTNAFNEWQGHMRFGAMSQEAFSKLQDRALLDASSCCQANIVMTHCNEADVPFHSSCFCREFFSHDDDFYKVVENACR